jgi:ferrous iron transport protein B
MQPLEKQKKSISISSHNRKGKKEAKINEMAALRTIAIVGNPNVGKSVLFNVLTGKYVTVSNYPGTTVEISKGKSMINGREYQVIDTPGMYSLLPITEEERVARSLLLEEKPEVILHVIDAKNIDRMLSFTIQLIEAGLPVILVLNMMDESDDLGIKIDARKLGKHLNIPVIPIVATSKLGLDVLKRRLEEHLKKNIYTVDYGEPIEGALEKISSILPDQGILSTRILSLMLLQEDDEIMKMTAKKIGEDFFRVKKIITTFKAHSRDSANYIITLKRQEKTREIIKEIVIYPTIEKRGLSESLSRITMNPWSGTIILFLILYFGLYKFVGGFGAGTIVDFLESSIFEKHINPWVTNAFLTIVPWKIFQDLFVGEYGILTLGIRYAVALILPIVGTFFLFFSIMEDSGYFPRMAMLIDRLFKRIGLNGRAVIPMVLGFGCATMATIVTRILETKRERVIATLLLALAIPCSAQLGVILGILAAKPYALLTWVIFILAIFLLVGYLTAKLMPGVGPSFFMELPPLRLPKLSNVLVKTYTRMQWYFLEIVPLFILASVLIWLGNITGLFQLSLKGLEPIVQWMGLPPEASVAFLFGFFRRDYGAAGLYDLSGQLTGNQMVVAAAALTLFLPCIAQFLVMKKERGLGSALGMSLFIFPFAFLMGFVLNQTLIILGINL